MQPQWQPSEPEVFKCQITSHGHYYHNISCNLVHLQLHLCVCAWECAHTKICGSAEALLVAAKDSFFWKQFKTSVFVRKLILTDYNSVPLLHIVRSSFQQDTLTGIWIQSFDGKRSKGSILLYAGHCWDNIVYSYCKLRGSWATEKLLLQNGSH